MKVDLRPEALAELLERLSESEVVLNGFDTDTAIEARATARALRDLKPAGMMADTAWYELGEVEVPDAD